MNGYDIMGNAAIVKFSKRESLSSKKRQAKSLLKKIKSISTVLEKTGKFKGRLRVQKTRHLAGIKTKEILYRENGCIFRFNADTCYFSPRLANERLEIAKQTRKNESVLVLFGGVAPFAIVIAKISRAKGVVSIELGKQCNMYAKENIRRNKVEKIVSLIQGDARKKIILIKSKFDRIVMPRPDLKDTFLDIVFPKTQRGSIIHYYGFCREDKLQELQRKVINEAEKSKREIKILNVKKAGNVGIRLYRYRIDLKVV